MIDKPSRDATRVLFVVDRLEGAVATLVDDLEHATTIDASALPAGCRIEGAVLRIPLAAGGQPAWQRAVRDRSEEKRRLEVNAARLERLRRKDPGGDVSL